MTAVAEQRDLASELGAAGLTWHANGQAALQGPLLRLSADCDRAFLALADVWGAREERHPVFLSAAQLQRIDYLHSFPQLATFPIALDAAEDNLDTFLSGGAVDESGDVLLTRTAPVRELLTPAACYHLYVHHEGESFDAARYLTTRNTCFRREVEYLPLQRQWVFDMREIVCIGTRAEVVDFLDRARGLVGSLCDALGFGVAWETATDPFFRPARNPKYLYQKIEPTKLEATFDGHLAIASVNLHQSHFGSAFAMTRAGDPAFSGCVAFGLERWLYALTRVHGADPTNWPDVPAVAGEVIARGSGGDV